jgi:hypothetical protein
VSREKAKSARWYLETGLMAHGCAKCQIVVRKQGQETTTALHAAYGLVAEILSLGMSQTGVATYYEHPFNTPEVPILRVVFVIFGDAAL